MTTHEHLCPACHRTFRCEGVDCLTAATWPCSEDGARTVAWGGTQGPDWGNATPTQVGWCDADLRAPRNAVRRLARQHPVLRDLLPATLRLVADTAAMAMAARLLGDEAVPLADLADRADARALVATAEDAEDDGDALPHAREHMPVGIG